MVKSIFLSLLFEIRGEWKWWVMQTTLIDRWFQYLFRLKHVLSLQPLGMEYHMNLKWTLGKLENWKSFFLCLLAKAPIYLFAEWRARKK